MTQQSANPSLTFVVRLHDNARFAAAAIEAALAQEHPGLEVLVLDDASSDDSAAIARRTLEAYRGPHATQLLCLPQNRGCGGALQAAAEASRGAVIVLADGDDLSDPTRAAAIAAAFAPDVQLVAHRQRLIDAAGQALAAATEQGSPPELIAAIAQGGGLAGAVSAYRRALFQGFQPLDGLTHSEDWLLTVRALLRGRVVLLPDLLVQRRSHAANVSGPTAALAAPAALRAWYLKHDRAAFPAYHRLRQDVAWLAGRGELTAVQAVTLQHALAQGLRRLRLNRAAARLPLWRLPALARALRRLGGSRRAVWRRLLLLRWPRLMLHQGRTPMRRAILEDVRRQAEERPEGERR